MNVLLNIPQHKNCANCGECCGLIVASREEVAEIMKYLNNRPGIRQAANKRNRGINCPFRNNEDKMCDIYPVRPILCRLMGVCKGLDCPNGNSADINGREFLTVYYDGSFVLNLIEW